MQAVWSTSGKRPHTRVCERPLGSALDFRRLTKPENAANPASAAAHGTVCDKLLFPVLTTVATMSLG